MENSEIARVLEDMGILLQILEANPFRIRAYENAARTVETHAEPMRQIVARGGDLTELPGIGKGIAAQITELVTTGKLTDLEDLTKEIPYALIDLVRLPGVGPKRAKQLWKELGVTTVDALEVAAREGAVEALPGFGKKTQERILRGIARLRERQSRFRLSDADRLVAPLIEYLASHPAVDRVAIAGSYRRRVETVGDIDILVTADDGPAVMQHFTEYERVRKVEKAGETRGTAILASGLQVDVRVVPAETYGAALQYFTGSKAHNVKVRAHAVGKGLRVSEYGVFRVDADQEAGEDPYAGERIAGATEEEVYEAIGIPWMPPELREDRGEVEAALAGTLPTVVALEDLRGDLQMHSTWSDGHDTIEDMVAACARRGYDYVAITDHSKSLAMTGGLDAAALREQWKEIREVQARHPDIQILRSLEIDIHRDGSLDLEDEAIEELDVVVVSIHSLFELPAEEQTARILTALQHPKVNIFAHPTGRLINERDPYAFDLDAVLECAREHRVAMELNAHPNRLDLNDSQLMLARERGVAIVISTDAHRVSDLDLMHYGVEQARRAWLEPGHVLNTRPWSEVRAYFDGTGD